MARYISRGIHCVVCNAPATHVTEFLYKDAEGYLCSTCDSRYIDTMQDYLDTSYPEIFYAHERTIDQMIVNK